MEQVSTREANPVKMGAIPDVSKQQKHRAGFTWNLGLCAATNPS
jgi:hypothetical protein